MPTAKQPDIATGGQNSPRTAHGDDRTALAGRSLVVIGRWPIDAITAATGRWMGSTISAATSRDAGIPRGMAYLTGFVEHANIEADAATE